MTASLRTPTEVALGVRLDLDLEDLTYGDLDAAEEAHEAHEADLLDRATATGDFLYREAVRASVARMGTRPSAKTDPVFPVTVRRVDA